MKFIDKMILCVFSVIMLIISMLGSFFIFGWIKVEDIYLIITRILADQVTCNIFLGLNFLFIILAIKAIFFESKTKEEKFISDGILLQNDDGKLLITRETLISIVNSVVSGFDSVKNQQSKIVIDENGNLSIVLTIEVADSAIIKELSNNIQIRVKETIKKSLDLEVKSLDIKIKNMVGQEEIKD